MKNCDVTFPERRDGGDDLGEVKRRHDRLLTRRIGLRKWRDVASRSFVRAQANLQLLKLSSR